MVAGGYICSIGARESGGDSCRAGDVDGVAGRVGGIDPAVGAGGVANRHRLDGHGRGGKRGKRGKRGGGEGRGSERRGRGGQAAETAVGEWRVVCASGGPARRGFAHCRAVGGMGARRRVG